MIDTETTSVNPATAELRVFGGYDVEEDRYFIIKYDLKTRGRIQDILDAYDWIITFNGENYDLPIMLRHDLAVQYWKHIDLFQVCKKRPALMNKEGFKSFSLRNIIKTLNLDDVGKGDIDYEIFQRTEWTTEEKEQIIKYLKQDLLLTAKLWKYMVARFTPFADFLNEKDVQRYKHITSSSGAYAYKVICNLAGIEEKYNDTTAEEKFIGAYVSTPEIESAKGIIVNLDFASLYPSSFIQFNLYSHSCTCCTDEEKFRGNTIFKTTGSYCTKKQGKIEETLKQLYQLRKQYKANKDNREYVVKIIINTMYGISGSPAFANLYNLNTAQDCTALGQQCIKWARQTLIDSGFQVLYSDTDSAYVLVPEGKTVEDIKECARYISQTLSENTPFPWSEFNFKVDDVLKYICFSKNDAGGFNKKHYLYITQDDKLVLKGIRIVRGDCSQLSVNLYEEILKNQIVENCNCKFDEDYIKFLIFEYLTQDMSLAAKTVNIKDSYACETSLQNQICKAFGPGEHHLIKNYKIGVGKKVKYCTIDEALKLNIDDLDIDSFLSELQIFIKR